MGVKVEMGAKSGEQIMQNWPWNKNCCQCPAYQILPSEASFDEDNEDDVDDEEDNDSHGDDKTGKIILMASMKKTPSETDVAAKAISEIGLGWNKNLWAKLC